jgi:hypothetical protein
MRSSFGRSCATGSFPFRASKSQVVTFDVVVSGVESLPAALDRATPGQVKRLAAMLAEEVTTVDRRVASIRLRPEAMPFFEGAEADLVWPPRTGAGL